MLTMVFSSGTKRVYVLPAKQACVLAVGEVISGSQGASRSTSAARFYNCDSIALLDAGEVRKVCLLSVWVRYDASHVLHGCSR